MAVQLRESFGLAGVAQLESSAASQDGTQRGSIQLSEDSTTSRGSVSSSSVGGNQAFASSSLTIGPTGTQASFTARGVFHGVFL